MTQVKQCLDHCPICGKRCEGCRQHPSLHQCDKHAWGTLEQRQVDIKNCGVKYYGVKYYGGKK